MPSNPLFWIVLAVVAVGYVATLFYLYSHQTQSDEGFHSGRVPGYSYTDGRNVGLDASVVGLEGGDWFPLRLETFHDSNRSRLILSLVFEAEIDGANPIEDFLAKLAAEVQERAEADVVFVQATGDLDIEGKWVFLHAPDGRGWWGAERVRNAFRSPLETPRIEF